MLARYFHTTTHSTLVRLFGIASFFALTALTASLKIPLPFTPVPLTLQLVVVLLAGLTLGAKDGAISQLVFLTAVAVGLPVGTSSLGLASPTLGYIVGFVVAAFIVGYLGKKSIGHSRTLLVMASLAGVIVIHLCGMFWLTFAFLDGDLARGWALGVSPFILVDGAKAIIAVGIVEGTRGVLGRITDE